MLPSVRMAARRTGRPRRPDSNIVHPGEIMFLKSDEPGDVYLHCFRLCITGVVTMWVGGSMKHLIA